MQHHSTFRPLQGRGRLDGCTEHVGYDVAEVRILFADLPCEPDGRWNVLLATVPSNSRMHAVAKIAWRHDLQVEWRIEDASPIETTPYIYAPARLGMLTIVQPLPDPRAIVIPDFTPDGV